MRHWWWTEQHTVCQLVIYYMLILLFNILAVKKAIQTLYSILKCCCIGHLHFRFLDLIWSEVMRSASFRNGSTAVLRHCCMTQRGVAIYNVHIYIYTSTHDSLSSHTYLHVWEHFKLNSLIFLCIFICPYFVPYCMCLCLLYFRRIIQTTAHGCQAKS